MADQEGVKGMEGGCLCGAIRCCVWGAIPIRINAVNPTVLASRRLHGKRRASRSAGYRDRYVDRT